MPGETQGSGVSGACSALTGLRLAVVAAATTLAGCAGGLDLRKAEIDDTLITSSVGDRQPKKDATRTSDETTIRNAVSAADPEAVRSSAIPWANVSTGSRGAITELVEVKDDSAVCRRFRATRESYDGVAVFKGETCLARNGLWQLVDFGDG